MSQQKPKGKPHRSLFGNHLTQNNSRKGTPPPSECSHTHGGDSFTLVYLARCTGEMALALPEDEPEHETRRSRSRSPVGLGMPWRFLFV